MFLTTFVAGGVAAATAFDIAEADVNTMMMMMMKYANARIDRQPNMMMIMSCDCIYLDQYLYLFIYFRWDYWNRGVGGREEQVKKEEEVGLAVK